MKKHGRAVLQLGIVLILLLELLLVSQRFDAYGLVMDGTAHGWRVLFGYLGQVAKVAVLFLVLLSLLLRREWHPLWKSIEGEADIVRAVAFLLPQFLSYWMLLTSSSVIFDSAIAVDTLATVTFFLWCLALAACLCFWALMFASPNFWMRISRLYWRPVFFAALFAVAVWIFTVLISRFWTPLSAVTFVLSSKLLALFNPELVVVEYGQKILGLGDFVVRVAPACSGYEGIGLITAFLALYLYLNSEVFSFPRALILFPLGILAIWLLNVVRIALLVMLGYHWSPSVAVGGFHSQAGWIAFILTSLGLLWFAGHWRFLLRTATPSYALKLPKKPGPAKDPNRQQAVATLLPLVAMLAMVLLTAAISSEFVWLYPLRVIAVLCLLVWCWPVLRMESYRVRPLAIVAGSVVALIWILMLFDSAPEFDQVFSGNLFSVPLVWSLLWLGFRFLGAVIAVPIAEELAFRGYMLCKLSGSHSYTRGNLPQSVVAILVSSLAFGALHGAWVAGTVAGLIYALVRLRSQHIGDAIAAHSITNLIVFLFAAYSGQWSLI